MIRGRHSLALWAALAIVGAAASVTAGDDLEMRVRKKVVPSIAYIEDLQGSFGSGVVVDKTHVLTNFHVVNSPMPLTVTAVSDGDGKPAERTFKDVRVVGIHPTYDLALVEVKGASLVPAELSRTVATGQAAFAIGNPVGDDGKARRNHVTRGLVSAAERSVDGRACIQTNVGIAPGNSGGALVNDRGQVIGIVTFRFGERARLGFAIPIRMFKRTDFKDLSQRKVDATRAAELFKHAEDIRTSIEFHPDDPRRPGLAALLYQQALAQNPKDPAIYSGMGQLNLDRKEHVYAGYCFKKAVGLAPLFSPALTGLGHVELARNSPAKAADYFGRGLVAPKDAVASSMAAEGLAEAKRRRGQWAQAAYACRWSQLLHPRSRRLTIRTEAWKALAPKLSKDHFALLMGKTKPEQFSLTELGTLKDPAAGTPPPSLPAASDRVARAIAEAMRGAPAITEKPLAVAMPQTVGKVVMGYYGCRLVLHYADANKLAVFNIPQGRFEGTIDVPDRYVLFAAGGGNLLVYLQQTKTFEVYDLARRRRTGRLPSRLPGKVYRMVMGANCGDRAVVTCKGEHGDEVHVMSLRSLNTVGKLPASRWAYSAGRWPISADAELTRVCSGNGMLTIRLSSITGKPITKRFRSFQLFPDGRRTFAGNVLGDIHLQTLRAFPEGMLHAIQGTDFYLQSIGLRSLLLQDPVTLAEVGRIQLPPKPRKVRSDKGDFGIDRVWASAHTGLAAIVHDRFKMIYVCRLALPKTTQAPRPRVARPGRAWTYDLNLPAGTQAKLESAPKGMTLDARKLSLSWTPGSDVVSRTAAVLLNLRRPDGRESYRTVFIPIDAGRE